MNPEELAALNARFESGGVDPSAIIAWAAACFMPRLATTSSFQTQSVVLLHLVGQTRPDIPVIFLDTGYHFAETLAYRDRLVQQFNLTLRIVRPTLSRAESIRRYGDALYKQDPDLCCYLNKVEPMQRALHDRDAWISGIRRDQTLARAHAQPVEQLTNGRIKINPLVTWTHRDLWSYIHRHALPTHPLFSQGYLSVGCAPCTAPVTDTDDERAGRWAGSGKTECGLHTDALHNPPDSHTPPVDTPDES
jgi:phosphoadenosine phosphosulfate reductase